MYQDEFPITNQVTNVSERTTAHFINIPETTASMLTNAEVGTTFDINDKTTVPVVNNSDTDKGRFAFKGSKQVMYMYIKHFCCFVLVDIICYETIRSSVTNCKYE